MARTNFQTQAGFVYETLRRRILSAELGAGTRMGVRQIAEELNTSIAPVRDALFQLANEQLVERGRGSGWSVTRITREMIDGGILVREALECQSARLCALAATPSDIDELMRLAGDVDAHFEMNQERDALTRELDQRLHGAIARVTGIPQLAREVKRWTVVHDWAHSFFRDAAGEWQSHVALVEGIASGDPDVAERQMREHIALGYGTTCMTAGSLVAEHGGGGRKSE